MPLNPQIIPQTHLFTNATSRAGRARYCALLWLSICLSVMADTVHAQDANGRARTIIAEAQAEGRDHDAPAKAATANYRIGAADVLLVEVAGEPDLKRKVKVTEQGTIQLPYITRPIKVAGLSEAQAAEVLRQEFLTILKEPQVTVFIDEYNALSAAIAGAVREPKRVVLTREMRLFDLIAMAGGLTDKAGDVIQLIHTRNGESIETIDTKEMMRRPELNRVIRDGDVVNVPESGVVYVTGSVRSAGAFPFKENLTLTQAVALAGGMVEDSKRKEVHLVRTNSANPNERTEQIFNLDEIGKDTKKDITLRPYDVVMVPEATAKKQVRSIIQAFAGGISSALGWGILR